MDRNTVYTVRALLVFFPEPCSSDKPAVILTRKVTLPITAEMLLSMARSNEFAFQGRSFKTEALKPLNLLSLECTASAYLSFEEQRDSEIMTGLIYSGWALAVRPDEARHLKYAIPEELLAQFETLQEQPA